MCTLNQPAFAQNPIKKPKHSSRNTEIQKLLTGTANGNLTGTYHNK